MCDMRIVRLLIPRPLLLESIESRRRGDRVVGTLVDGTWNVPTTLTFVGFVWAGRTGHLGTCTYFSLERFIHSSIDKLVKMNVVFQAFDLNLV
jgi:hypothetical protein